jgi:hypothetical protein
VPAGVNYSPELGERICGELSDGKSLTAICAAPDMPDRRTVQRWLVDPANTEFRQTYDTARLAWADTMFEQIAELGEEARRVAEDADTRGGNSNAAVAAIREEIRAKMWVCGRLRPDKYGDRISAELTGAGGRDLIPATRESRLPQIVAMLAVLLPGRANNELFDLAGQLLDRLPAPGGEPRDG